MPTISKVRLIRSKKPHGYQYSITIPVDYGRTLDQLGVENLVIAFDRGFSGVPETDPEAERFLIAFLTKHPELKRFFVLGEKGA